MHYDLIVLGTGGVGSAALYSAARRGMSCLGLDRFPPAHDRGSSHGESRLIRLSYFEHPDYVPLLRRSYRLWDELDNTLLDRCGVLYCGPERGSIITGVMESARRHDLVVNPVDPGDYGHHRFPEGSQAVFEPQAGWLPVERCVKRHLDEAAASGAEHRWGDPVTGWHTEGSGVRVTTTAGTYSASALVVSPGPWASRLLPGLSLPLEVQRKHMHWFECEDKRYENGFFYDLPHGQFYGFPQADGLVKVAEHSGGESVQDPLLASREPDPEDDKRVAEFVANFLPGVQGPRIKHKSCFYTRTPDDHFVVDRYPGSDCVAYAAGLSGHGFKFAPVLGELLVDLATGEEAAIDVTFLSRARLPD